MEHLEQIPSIKLTFVQAIFVLKTFVHVRKISTVNINMPNITIFLKAKVVAQFCTFFVQTRIFLVLFYSMLNHSLQIYLPNFAPFSKFNPLLAIEMVVTSLPSSEKFHYPVGSHLNWKHST